MMIIACMQPKGQLGTQYDNSDNYDSANEEYDQLQSELNKAKEEVKILKAQKLKSDFYFENELTKIKGENVELTKKIS